MPFLVLLQNQIHSTRPVLAQENENFADVPCGPGKADGEEEIHKDWIISEIKSAYSASTLWTQMHTGGGGNPCRLMKLIMRNHSSSMRSNDERADPHMWILIVQYKRWTTRHENLISCRTATGYSIKVSLKQTVRQICCFISDAQVFYEQRFHTRKLLYAIN